MLVQWTALRPSLRARRWRQVALIIAAASSIALAAAAGVSRPFDVGLVMLAFLAAVAAAAALRTPATPSFEVAVASDGQVRLRERKTEDSDSSPSMDQPISVTFAAPWLISVRRGTILIPIWPDSLPQSVFRRLWVHLRWGRAVMNRDQSSGGLDGGRR